MATAMWRGLHRGSVLRSRCLRVSSYATTSASSFPTTPPKTSAVSKEARMFDGVVQATLQFHAIHGHFVIPVGFRVPKVCVGPENEKQTLTASQWLESLRGFALGWKLKALLTNPKHKLGNSSIVNELRTIGVPVDVDWREFLWQEMTLKALTVYKELHGDLFVQRNFVVPDSDSRWPRATWGYRLGLRVMNMRQRRYDVTPQEASDLEELGFVWDVHDHVWATRVLPALQTFKAVYGHCNVEQSFVVPAATPWTELTWDLALGSVVNMLRSPVATYAHQVQRDHEILDELGFAWDAFDDRWERVLLPALETYVQVRGHAQRPHTKFTVPAEAPWPKATWHFGLGTSVHNIRHLGVYRRQVLRDAKHLRAIGWLDLLTDRWERTMVEAAATK